MQDTEATSTAQNISEQTAQEKITRPKKRKFNFKRSRLYLTLGAVFGALFLIYFLIGLHYRNVFFPATTINGIDVSGLTPAQAQELLNSTAAEYILTIIEDGEKTEQITGREIGLCILDDNSLPDIVDAQNTITWAIQGSQEKPYSLDMTYDEEKLSSIVNTLSCMDEKNQIPPVDAYITYEKGTGYRIVPDLPGSKILSDVFFKAIKTALLRMDDSLSLRDAGVYQKSEVSADDSVLTEHFAMLQPYSDMTVTYKFDDQTEVLNGDTLSEWLSFDKNGKLTIDEEKAAEFIKGLAKKYNTAYSPKILETSYGKTVTIKGGFYGWQIDKEAEVEALLEVIREGKSVTREPVYLLSAASHGDVDYGDTYVEINLTAQHLFYYKDGELLVESDFVSGNPSHGNATPDGAYAITYTERNATLKGQNYRTPVSYWMPFNGNIGMHDSSWRSAFGGVIYQTNGSHGCINLPPAAAKTIFENIEKGIPVLCYHLSGTEQTPDALTAAQIAAGINPAESAEPGAGNIPSDLPAPPTEGLPVEIPPADGSPIEVPPVESIAPPQAAGY